MGYDIIEHTADVGLEVWGDGVEEAFSDAARGLIAIMGSGTGPDAPAVTVNVSSPDLEALLVDWLSEILYLFEVRGLVYEDAELRISPARSGGHLTLEAEVRGGHASGFVQTGAGVKAVTYHALSVTQGPEGVRARVYLDV